MNEIVLIISKSICTHLVWIRTRNCENPLRINIVASIGKSTARYKSRSSDSRKLNTQTIRNYHRIDSDECSASCIVNRISCSGNAITEITGHLDCCTGGNNINNTNNKTCTSCRGCANNKFGFKSIATAKVHHFKRATIDYFSQRKQSICQLRLRQSHSLCKAKRIHCVLLYYEPNWFDARANFISFVHKKTFENVKKRSGASRPKLSKHNKQLIATNYKLFCTCDDNFETISIERK